MSRRKDFGKAPEPFGSVSSKDMANGVKQNRDFVPPPAGQSDPEHLKQSKKILASVRAKHLARIAGGENDLSNTHGLKAGKSNYKPSGEQEKPPAHSAGARPVK